MFDVGFWELCLVGLIGLLVIGPERLPKVARVAGYWLGKTRSLVASVKQEIREELCFIFLIYFTKLFSIM